MHNQRGAIARSMSIFALLCGQLVWAQEPRAVVADEAGCLVGTVTNRATSEPVSGAMVVAKRKDTTLDAPSESQQYSDAQGRYRICGLLPGTYDVTTPRSLDTIATAAGIDETLVINGRHMILADSTSRTVTRTIGQDDMAPGSRELELSAGVAFITGRGVDPSGVTVAFTDVGLLRGGFAVAPRRGIRVNAGATALIKQPGSTSHSIWQSADAGIDVQLAPRIALQTHVRLGSTMTSGRLYQTAQTGLGWRKRINDYLLWEASASASATRFARASDPGWLVEASAHASAQACFDYCERQWGAGWIRMNYAASVVHAADLKPGPRLDLEVGAFGKVRRRWYMFISASILDRGDRGDPATQLPILDGGFDQTQLTLGILWAHRPVVPGDRDD